MAGSKKKLTGLKGKKTTKATAAEADGVRGGARKLKAGGKLIQKWGRARQDMKE
ncbi:MAG: hypothetical protein IPK12_23955 [Gemmatimonadetes bacterium]|nr:hypothetical protein [Gemmatimonadota bacterium]